MLTQPTSGREYALYNDASKIGLGCVLMQDGKVVASVSKQMKLHEQNYPTHDIKLQERVQLVSNGDKTCYYINDDDGLYYKIRLCVSNVHELKKKLMYESHNTVFTMHPRGNKMYQDLKQYYRWRGMKKDIVEYVSKCLTCQQVKVEHQVRSGLLNPLPVP